ncbi:MAG TPA: ABC transporter family substrate-binding protein [Vicinamibacterales bacterium]|nr:ABC transporter family substrate-binding protein [Vicinamibacterales bacterium]
MSSNHVAALCLALVASTTAACTSGSASDGPLRSQSSTQNQIHALPRDQVQDGGTFTWTTDNMPANYNYHHLDGTEVAASDVSRALTPSTYTSDAAGNPVWSRALLAAEPTVVTDPKQVVTFEINPRAAWYDGTPITWEEFHWQWRANNGTDKRYQIASSNGWEAIENVARGKDDREVIVTFKERYADWPAVFSSIYPASTNRDPTIFNEGWKDRPLTSAGPFKLGAIDVTGKTITLVRNEKWWGNPAKLDRIVFRVIDPDAQIDALSNGEIDAMDVGPDVNKFNRAKDIEGTDVRMAGAPNFRHLTINGTSPNISDVRVRQALAMAISRAAITRAMLAPLGIVTAPLGNHIFMSNQAGYRDNSGDVGKYNPERAKQLLDEAGWRMDGAVRKKDGRPLEVVMVIPTAVNTSKQEAELMQNMLAQVGVRLVINTVPSPDFFEKYITPGQFDFTVFSWYGTPYPMSSSRSLYSMPTRGANGEMNIQQNYARIGTPEIDRMFGEANRELDRAKAREIANQLDALLWQEVHSLTLYQRPEIVVTRSTLANFGAWGFAEWQYEDTGWAR